MPSRLGLLHAIHDFLPRFVGDELVGEVAGGGRRCVDGQAERRRLLAGSPQQRGARRVLEPRPLPALRGHHGGQTIQGRQEQAYDEGGRLLRGRLGLVGAAPGVPLL